MLYSSSGIGIWPEEKQDKLLSYVFIKEIKGGNMATIIF